MIRDTQALEYRFDLESMKEDVERYKRRISEVESAYHSATAMLEKASASVLQGNKGTTKQGVDSSYLPPNASYTTSAGQGALGKNRSKREMELEGVIDAMKRVVEKVRNENERLRRGGVMEDDRKLAEVEKKYSIERKKADKLQQELSAINERCRELEGNQSKLTQKQTQLAQLRKQLKTRDDEYKLAKEDLDALRREQREWNDTAVEYEARIHQMDYQLQALKGQQSQATQSSLRTLESKYEETIHMLEAQHQKEAEARATEIAQIQLENTRLKRRIDELSSTSQQALLHPTPSLTDQLPRQGPASDADYNTVLQENVKLKQELSAFDLEFFEEIENLKYAYSEAVKKLQVYEGGI